VAQQAASQASSAASGAAGAAGAAGSDSKLPFAKLVNSSRTEAVSGSGEAVGLDNKVTATSNQVAGISASISGPRTALNITNVVVNSTGEATLRTGDAIAGPTPTPTPRPASASDDTPYYYYPEDDTRVTRMFTINQQVLGSVVEVIDPWIWNPRLIRRELPLLPRRGVQRPVVTSSSVMDVDPWGALSESDAPLMPGLRAGGTTTDTPLLAGWPDGEQPPQPSPAFAGGRGAAPRGGGSAALGSVATAPDEVAAAPDDEPIVMEDGDDTIGDQSSMALPGSGSQRPGWRWSQILAIALSLLAALIGWRRREWLAALMLGASMRLRLAAATGAAIVIALWYDAWRR
jgi:hypothetical protein